MVPVLLLAESISTQTEPSGLSISSEHVVLLQQQGDKCFFWCKWKVKCEVKKKLYVLLLFNWQSILLLPVLSGPSMWTLFWIGAIRTETDHPQVHIQLSQNDAWKRLHPSVRSMIDATLKTTLPRKMMSCFLQNIFKEMICQCKYLQQHNMWSEMVLMSRSPTSAGLVIYELKSRSAVTLKANHHVFADVRAAAVVQETLV